MYYLCSKNKGVVNMQLICIFVFAYATSRFNGQMQINIFDCTLCVSKDGVVAPLSFVTLSVAYIDQF